MQHILVCIMGLSPQVVTETLYALTKQQGYPLDELRLVTSRHGDQKAREANLFDRLRQLYRSHKIPPPQFDPAKDYTIVEEESFETYKNGLPDDPAFFPNTVTALLRELTGRPDTAVFGSLAGGRKTMSVMMAQAFSLFARKQDQLYHVLAAPAFEKSGRFFPESPAEADQIVLVHVPFIRLRDKLPLLQENPTASFSQLIRFADDEIARQPTLSPLILQPRRHQVSIGQAAFHLTPFHFAVYQFFAQQPEAVPGGKQFSPRHARELWAIYEDIAPSEGRKELMQARTYKQGAIEFQVINKSISTIRRQLHHILPSPALTDFYAIKAKGDYSRKLYGIQLPFPLRKIVGN